MFSQKFNMSEVMSKAYSYSKYTISPTGYASVTNNLHPNIKELQEKGFTVREIEILSGVSKSQVSRSLQEA